MRTHVLLLLSFLLLFLGGCGPVSVKRSLDKQVANIVAGKSGTMKGQKLPAAAAALDDKTGGETLTLDLKDCLVMAAKNNRDYQSKKEDVYLMVLNLLYQKYLYGPQFSFGGTAGWSKGDGEESVSASAGPGLIWWLGQGAQITLNLTESFLQYLTGSKEKSFQGLLDLDLFQPLLRGAGRTVARENFVQADRNVVYQIRTFLRYQRTFSVSVASAYYSLVLDKKKLDNYWNNYISLKETRERLEMLATAGRIQPLQSDQARQDEYSAYQQWVAAVNSFRMKEDSFAVMLGLPPGQRFVWDDQALEVFFKNGIPSVATDYDAFVRSALSGRLDLLTAYDQVEDARRKVFIAADDLRPQLDLNASVSSQSPDDSDATFGLADTTYGAGFSFSLPIQNVQDRNAYVSALITRDRQQRVFTLVRDTVIQSVRSSLRSLDEARQTYEIQKRSVELARRRVESADLLLQAGRATTRDLLDAQTAFLSATNNYATSVVSYLNAYLSVLTDTESLEIDDSGVWKGDIYATVTGHSLEVPAQ